MRTSVIRLQLSFPLIFLVTIRVATLRLVKFETTEVTSPDVAVSPDGQWLIFTLLGHLFRLPVAGGSAKKKEETLGPPCSF